MTDKELLELAAKAAGIELLWECDIPQRIEMFRGHLANYENWNPLTNDGDALRLAVKLRIIVTFSAATGRYCVIGCQRLGPDSIEEEGNDAYAATRRAIVRAAAEIGKEMK
jgi:hypothetical protein